MSAGEKYVRMKVGDGKVSEGGMAIRERWNGGRRKSQGVLARGERDGRREVESKRESVCERETEKRRSREAKKVSESTLMQCDGLVMVPD